MGSCLAGDTCIFSHDPTQSANKLSSEQQQAPRIVPTTPPPQFQLHDFPSLSPEHYSLNNALVSPPPGFKHLSNHPRPISRNQNRSPSPAVMNIPSVDD